MLHNNSQLQSSVNSQQVVSLAYGSFVLPRIVLYREGGKWNGVEVEFD